MDSRKIQNQRTNTRLIKDTYLEMGLKDIFNNN